jgi:structure-specific recognition protein 1
MQTKGWNWGSYSLN